MDDRFGLVGQRVADRYDIHDLVARGGFGLVYRGVHATLNKHVAIKVLLVPRDLNEAAQATFIENFLSEAELIARLDHPSIVRVLDSGVVATPRGETVPWMALDWIDGENLSVYLKARCGQGGRTPAEALALMDPIFSALAYAHEQGIAHRDVKPANVMVPPVRPTTRPSRHASSGLRLLDFGIAKIMDVEEQAGEGHTRTRSKNVSFSPLWAAPEQVGSSRTGPWTDVHALALILTQVLTDRRPFSGQDEAELWGQVLSPQRPTPAAAGVDVGAWEAVIAKALSLRPADRFSNAGEFLAALDDALPRASHKPAAGVLSNVTAPNETMPGSQPLPLQAVSGTTLDPKVVPGTPGSLPVHASRLVVGAAAAIVLAIAVFGVRKNASHAHESPPTRAVPGPPAVAIPRAAPSMTTEVVAPDVAAPIAPLAQRLAPEPDVETQGAAPPSTLDEPPGSGRAPVHRGGGRAVDHRALGTAPSIASAAAASDASNDADAFAQARAAGADNAAIVRLLSGHAHSESAMAMLIAAYRSIGDRESAMRVMHVYLTRYRTGAYKDEYLRFLDANDPHPTRSPRTRATIPIE